MAVSSHIRPGGAFYPARGSQRPLWPFTINRDSPQSSGLVFWVPTWEGTGGTIDLVGGHRGTFKTAGTGSLPVWGTDVETLLRVETSETSAADIGYIDYGDHDDFDITGDITIAYRLFLTSLGTSSLGGHLSKWSVTSASRSYLVGHGFITAGRLDFFTGDGAAQDSITDSVSLPLNEWHSIVAIQRGTARRLFRNGKLVANDTKAKTMPITTKPLLVGALRDDHANKWGTNGHYADIRIHNIGMPDEYAEWFDNPRTRWDLYKPLRGRVDYVAAIAAVGGLSIPVAMHEYRQRHQSVV